MRGRLPLSRTWLWLAGGVCLALGVLGAVFFSRPRKSPQPVAQASQPARYFAKGRKLTAWWDDPPPLVQVGSVPSGQESNINRADYVGPEACKDCHAQNYKTWSAHPHHWMNALADAGTIKGDFSAEAAIAYRGGRATFRREANKYVMSLERDGVRRTYVVNQTIGSRFYQRYVGKQVEGPEPKSHHFYAKDHVLPFGYWLEEKEWMPLVHIGVELPDEQRPDPFVPPDRGIYYAEYASGCNYCHTTFPLADLFSRHPVLVGENAPVPLHWSLRDYLAEAHPDLLPAITEFVEQARPGKSPMGDWEAPTYAVTLGISCEACHLGGREHVASGGKVPPKFFPSSPHLLIESEQARDYGRTHDNVNWACGRCHTGNRPRFAAGMATWNSTEYSDAMRGSCYSQLRCVDCHNPHRATGRRWSKPPDQEDALCLKCHARLEPAAARREHTHHQAGSDGARCQSCHMPRINEGLQDVVRTHMIYSPTRSDMIEANHPNACNLCHTRQPIDWTLRYLKEWYGGKYDDGKIADSYPRRTEGVAAGWLRSENPAVRLVAVEALTRARDMQALPQLLDALDDSYLVNRQFAYKDLQEMLGLRLRDLGYRFYMTKEERRKPLADLRARLSRAAEAKGR